MTAHTPERMTVALERPFAPDGGLAVRTTIPAAARDALVEGSHRVTAEVTEDGRRLTCGDAAHAFIRANPDAFSVWGDDLYWSASDGSDCNSNGREYALTISRVTPQTGSFSLAPPFGTRGEYGFRVNVPAEAYLAMQENSLVQACSVVREDGVPLALPNAQHQVIEELGHGRYSIWQRGIYFSSSDGSDCRTNGKTYDLLVPDPAFVHAAVDSYKDLLAQDDAALLALLRRSGTINNTFANNFLHQCNAALRWLQEQGGVSGHAAVLGCGATPWTPIRLLAEGFTRVVANDLLEVRTSFDAREVDDLLYLLPDSLSPQSKRLASLRRPAGDAITFEGLEVRGGQLFEEMVLPEGSIDFIYSNSVLEHVMQPEAVYAAMAHFLRPEGKAFHAIDLRDHLHYFDPLRFLTMSRDEYASINTENRLRASDHIRLAEEAGFTVEIHSVSALTPGGGSRSVSENPPLIASRSLDTVEPALDDATMRSLHPDFQSYSNADLSVVGIELSLERVN